MATHALAFVYGGADVGGALAADPRVRTVHLTGSEATFNALVWGGPPPAAAGGGGAAAHAVPGRAGLQGAGRPGQGVGGRADGEVGGAPARPDEW